MGRASLTAGSEWVVVSVCSLTLAPLALTNHVRQKQHDEDPVSAPLQQTQNLGCVLLLCLGACCGKHLEVDGIETHQTQADKVGTRRQGRQGESSAHLYSR